MTISSMLRVTIRSMCIYCEVKKAVEEHFPYCSRNCLVYDREFKK